MTESFDRLKAQKDAILARELKPPMILNDVVDKVLAYKPKPKSKAAQKRKRRQAKHG